MVNLRVLLKPNSHQQELRCCRKELIQFADDLALHLGCGLDLSHSWLAASAADNPTMLLLRPEPNAGLADHIRKAATAFPQPEFRHWFRLLHTSYLSGSPLIPLVRSFTNSLRRDQQRDFESHAKSLPTRTNILLLVFFLPPALLAIFLPLLLRLLESP